MTLDIRCADHLASVRAYADSQGADIREQLESKLAYLEHYAQDTCVCVLSKDFAPHSFYFIILGPERAGERDVWFNGGLIHHAPHSNGVSGPEYAVTLTPQARPHWSVHT